MNNQRNFLDLLQKCIPPHTSVVNCIADTLNCSIDAAYRRVRCTTEFSLTETLRLCQAYNVPLDLLSSNASNMVSFEINPMDENTDFEKYLEKLYDGIFKVAQNPKSHITYASEDLPVFYHFAFASLAKFKMVYWNKSLLNVAIYQQLKVEEIEIPSAWLDKIKAINETFSQINVTEIWNEDTIKSTVQQIRFYWEAGFFSSSEFALEVCQDLKLLLLGINRQAELGHRLNLNKMQTQEASYTFYISDLMIGSNTVQIEIESIKFAYLGYNTFNFLITQNLKFNQSVNTWLSNIRSKSTLASNTGEKHRNQFFKKQIKTVDELINQINTDIFTKQ